jgi:hypothetical protein
MPVSCRGEEFQSHVGTLINRFSGLVEGFLFFHHGRHRRQERNEFADLLTAEG